MAHLSTQGPLLPFSQRREVEIARGATAATIDPAVAVVVADSVFRPIEVMPPYGWPNRSNWLTTWTRAARDSCLNTLRVRFWRGD